ncbi:MAG: conjugal transfer protein TraF [Sideroxydans sp.]|nr:conjugal transfer protein TraF [Sideroxydans sp.]
MKHILQLAAATLTLVCASAAAQDGTFDPRALAMGGTGVTTSDNSNAVFHNAAMLASSKHDDSFSLETPIIAVRLLDPQSLQNDSNTLSTNANALTNALTAFNNSQAAGNAAQAQIDAGTAGAALARFSNSLVAVNSKTLSGNALAGMVLAVPSNRYAFSFYSDARAELGAQFNYAAGDQVTINNLAANLTQCSAGTAAACQAANNAAAGGKVAGLTSSMDVRGVVAKDFGLGVARHFDNFYDLDIGIVPKFTMYSTYDFKQQAQGNTKIALNQGKKDFSAFSMDVGAAKTFQREADTQIKAGLAIKNLIPSSGTTVLGNRIEAKPLATVGVSYETAKTSSGIDLDLTPNKALMTGFNKDAQYLRLGAEFDAWRWAQIRIGYRHDIKGNYPGLPSIGLGLSPFGIHADLSVAAASKKEAAISLQTGFRF